MKKEPYVLLIVLLLMLAGLQYRLWLGDGGIAQGVQLKMQIAEQKAENERLLERNRVMDAEVMELKKGMETVEERARYELGMVKEGGNSLLVSAMTAPVFWLVIPAAGIGSRMQAECPKQYLTVAGKTILELTLGCFLAHPQLLGIVVAVAEHDSWWPTLELAEDPRVHTVIGGGERADSVLNAVLALENYGAQADDWVLVHDAARPLLEAQDLQRLLTQLADDPVGGLLAVPARDTLKQINAEGQVLKTLDRSVIWHALTPQMFRVGALQRALADALQAGVAVTDESSAMEWAGFAPRVIEGSAMNIKITRPEDLQLLHRLRGVDAP